MYVCMLCYVCIYVCMSMHLSIYPSIYRYTMDEQHGSHNLCCLNHARVDESNHVNVLSTFDIPTGISAINLEHALLICSVRVLNSINRWTFCNYGFCFAFDAKIIQRFSLHHDIGSMLVLARKAIRVTIWSLTIVVTIEMFHVLSDFALRISSSLCSRLFIRSSSLQLPGL